MNIYNFSQIEDAEEFRRVTIRIFGKKIKNIRLKKGLTQEQVGELADINPKYLGEIERGEKNPTALVIYKLSMALHIPVCELFSISCCPFASAEILKEIARLSSGKGEKELKKALRILEVLFE